MIDRGPRLDALRQAVGDAASAFGRPLSDEARERGWTPEQLEAVHAALVQLCAALEFDATARLDVVLPLGGPEPDELDDDLVEVLAAIDYLSDDLDVADGVLADAEALLTSLRGDDGLGAAHDELAAALEGIVAALATGRYLGGELDDWDAALGRHGCRRADADGPPETVDVRALAGNLVEWPRGKSWDRVVVFDSRLGVLRRRDPLATSEPAD